jgi:GntR family transcriptional regulator
MYIRIDTSSGVPIWQQVVSQVTRQAVSGVMGCGDQLPTVRELAGELRVNPNTIAKAYQELERTGIVSTKRGLGTFVIEQLHKGDSADGIKSLKERIDAAIVESMQMRLDPNTFVAIVQERIEAMNREAKAIPTVDDETLSHSEVGA